MSNTEWMTLTKRVPAMVDITIEVEVPAEVAEQGKAAIGEWFEEYEQKSDIGNRYAYDWDYADDPMEYDWEVVTGEPYVLPTLRIGGEAIFASTAATYREFGEDAVVPEIGEIVTVRDILNPCPELVEVDWAGSDGAWIVRREDLRPIAGEVK